MGVTLDYFSVSLLIGGFTALISGFAVYIHNHKTTENISWFFFNITSAIWSFGYFATINATNAKSAFIYDWILHLAAILVPLFCLLSVVSITNTHKENKIGVTIFSLIGLFFLISTPTKLFVKDVIPKAGFHFVPDAGPLYIYFTLYFFLLVFYVLYILFKKYRESTDLADKQRFEYMIFFTAIGSMGGGSVFFLTFNIPVLPYPIILFSLFPVVSIYAIFRFRLFNVRIITTEFLVFSLWIFIFIRTLVSVSTEERIINSGLLLFMVVTGILLIRSVVKEVRQREQIEKLVKDVEESNIKLKEANQNQSSLMHFMNHQVKGRLGNAKNIFAELLTDDYGVIPEFAKPLLIKGLDEANMGVDYVQNILKGTSAENGTLPYDMKEINVKDIIETTFSKQKDYAEKKGLKINLKVEDGEYKMTGDSLELGEAIRNLIDNSINYTPEGSIELTLSTTRSNITLKIKDTGIGITEEDKGKLFKSGGRGTDSLKINTNSTGYGLSFVKGVVEAHKGKVWVESEGRGKGSTFFVELPKS